MYKIIDLGYAKDIGHGSIPQSFAGTLQYAVSRVLWVYVCLMHMLSSEIVFEVTFCRLATLSRKSQEW